MAKRIKIEGYPGVYYRMSDRIGAKGQDRVYYVTFKRDGKLIEAKAGRQHKDQMTPAKANRYRSRLIDGKEQTPQEKREAEKAAKAEKAKRWTVDRLWREYKAGRKPGKSLATDAGRYENYIEPAFAKKEPKDILALDVERLKRQLLIKRSPQTVKHVLNLLTWIVNFGVKQGLCPGLSFHIGKPQVSNTKTEDLSPAQLKRLLTAIAEDTHAQAGNMMLMALYSGMRRGEMFKLQWSHVDFDRGFIRLVDPKGGVDQMIPLNDQASKLLKGIAKTKGSPYVFPGRGGGQRTDINKAVAEIKKKAGLPKDFRALHGLRHVFASQLASSGEVDLYVVQKLLGHKDARMTARYAHLRDTALKRASGLAGDIVDEIAAAVDSDKDKIVNLESQKHKVTPGR
ncbi:MAG: site-specific integrase [Desulfobacteraceae bacterium]|nr:site-specific integrase [Desulfobacteraceae bacterium]MBC2749600.1 site-specific integrase [Desulfobacteraceae bacterium]